MVEARLTVLGTTLTAHPLKLLQLTRAEPWCWINATTFLMRDVTIGIRPAVPALQTARKTHSGQRALSIALRPAMPTEQLLRQLSRIGIDVRESLGQHILKS